jgi:hypothetical protein
MNGGLTQNMRKILVVLGPRYGCREVMGADFKNYGWRTTPYGTLSALRHRGLVDWIKYQDDGRKIYFFLTWYGEAALRKWDVYKSIINEAADWVNAWNIEVDVLSKNPKETWAPITAPEFHAQIGSNFGSDDPFLPADAKKSNRARSSSLRPRVRKRRKATVA